MGDRWKPTDNHHGGSIIGGYSSEDAIGEENPTLIVARFHPVSGRMLVDSTEGGFTLPEYDYVSMTLSAGDTTETYTFKDGGSGGTTVATVVVVYTDSTREILSTVTKT